MPRHRTTSRRTEEQKMKLNVDLRCIPEWEAELKSMDESIRDRFQLFSLPKIILAATLIQEIRIKLDILGVVDWKREQHELEQWKTTLTVDKLICLSTDYSAPDYLHRGSNMVEKIRAGLKDAEDTLARIKAGGVTDSFWVSLFTGKCDVGVALSWEQSRAKYLALSREIPKIEDALRLLEEVNTQSRDYRDRVSQLKNKLALAEEKRAAIARFEAKHGKALAKGAAADKETRKRVTNLKVVVKKTKDCPYCGGDLGAEPHLDHIYPVTKGGLSIVENLIWCCSTCNGLKSDKGLMQFLKEQGLPIEQTLTRLHSIGKHV